jgi:2-oxoacid:acceptor oxidoreductase gamma subunit (pyruvate/2-ketoisovalerate family)
MIEIAIHGRGGGGAVTLAKLIAGAFFLRQKYVQAFGEYGAERSGAPVHAYVRVDDQEITLYGPISAPDHVVITDPSLIAPDTASHMSTDGWIVINSPHQPSTLAADFPGRRLASVDANAIAFAHHLGSAALPIVNTAVFGAVARFLGLVFADVEAALALARLGGENLKAAQAAYEGVRTHAATGTLASTEAAAVAHPHGFFDAAAGSPPIIHTGEWASRRPTSRELGAPCSSACPAGNDVRRFLDLASRQDYDGSLATILERSPFPGVCGRVCPAPCMSACNRSQLDDPVNVREVERAIADRGHHPPVTFEAERSERVAVLGAGPAGLTAAYHLARAGFGVTVFEAAAEPGGVLRSGIPTYRLPRDVLDTEVAFIAAHGVELRTKHPLAHDGIERLCCQYEAVLVASGRTLPQTLDLGRAENGHLRQGVEFLDAARRGEVSLHGRRVIVLGGGNTAVDAARSALRTGADHVSIVYRRSLHEMPAIPEEIEEALEEGVEIKEFLAPQGLHAGDEGLTLACRRTTPGSPDDSGRRSAVELPGDDNVVHLGCDEVLLALGQSPDLTLLDADVPPTEQHPIVGMGPALVVAGGDFAGAESTVAEAIGSGRRAAAYISSTLAGDATVPPPVVPLAGPEEVAVERFPRIPQHRSLVRPASERCKSFDEVRVGLVDSQGSDTAAAEAARCLSCGSCNACATCVAYCPEGVVRIDQSQRLFIIDDEYCKGCGLCAAECPRGVVVVDARG